MKKANKQALKSFLWFVGIMSFFVIAIVIPIISEIFCICFALFIVFDALREIWWKWKKE